MPILLTTPFSTGEMNEDPDYTHFKIGSVNIDLRSKTITFTGGMGHYVEGAWVWGDKRTARTYKITGDDYVAILAANQSLYDGLAAALYAEAQEADSRVAGTVQ